MILDWLRNLRKTKEEREREAITAYLDGQLSSAERTALEKELAHNSGLQAELEAQRQVKASLSQLPRLKAPRNFTLDPAVYGKRQPSLALQLYPKLRLASAAMTVLLVAVVAVEWNIQSGPNSNAAPMASQSEQSEQAEVAMVEAEPTLPPMLTEEVLVYSAAEATPDMKSTEEIMASEAADSATASDTTADESLPSVPAIPPNAGGSVPVVGSEAASGSSEFAPPSDQEDNEPPVESTTGGTESTPSANQEGDVAVAEEPGEAEAEAMPTASLVAPRPEDLATDTMRVMSETPENAPTESTYAYDITIQTPETPNNSAEPSVEEVEVPQTNTLTTVRNLLTVAVALLVITTVYFRSKLD